MADVRESASGTRRHSRTWRILAIALCCVLVMAVAAIHVLDPPIVNTVDEIRLIGKALDGGKNRSVILVTTKAHTRRVRLLWRRLVSGHGRAIVRAASGDPFDPQHWWRTTNDALDVVREVLGLLNAWAGLPLGPAH